MTKNVQRWTHFGWYSIVFWVSVVMVFLLKSKLSKNEHVSSQKFDLSNVYENVNVLTLSWNETKMYRKKDRRLVFRTLCSYSVFFDITKFLTKMRILCGSFWEKFSHNTVPFKWQQTIKLNRPKKSYARNMRVALYGKIAVICSFFIMCRATYVPFSSSV